MSSILFILLKSPSEYADLDTMAAIGGDARIGVLLFEDATLFSIYKEAGEDLLSIVDEAYVMNDDLESRGLKGRARKGFEEVDYPRAINLIMDEYEKTITL